MRPNPNTGEQEPERPSIAPVERYDIRALNKVYRRHLRKQAAKLLKEMRQLADVYLDIPDMKRPRNGLMDHYPRDFRIGAGRCLDMLRYFCRENL